MSFHPGLTVAAGLASMAVCLGGAPGVTARVVSGSPIRLGRVVQLPVVGNDAESPVLAMNPSGRYLIGYALNDPFGSFVTLVGSTSWGRIPTERVVRLGTKSDIKPLEPAIAADGRVALGWSVRRQLRPASRVAFGQDLAERAPRSGARWAVHPVLAPTTAYNPVGGSGAPAVVFDGDDRLLEDWTTLRGSIFTLVLARQSVAGGPLRDRTVLRTQGYRAILPVGLAVDRTGNPIIAANLLPPARATPAGRAARAPMGSAVAFTARSQRQLGAPQRLRRGCGVASLAAVASGRAAIALLCNLGLFRTQVWVSERAPGRRFGRAVRVSGVEAEGTRSAAVSITATGQVCVVWDHIVGNVFNAFVVRTEVKCAVAGSRFSAPTWQTGRYPAQLNGPQLLAGPSGLTLARGDGDKGVVLQQLLPGGHLGPTVRLSQPQVSDQALAVDADGRGIAVWDAPIRHKNRPEARAFTLP